MRRLGLSYATSEWGVSYEPKGRPTHVIRRVKNLTAIPGRTVSAFHRQQEYRAYFSLRSGVCDLLDNIKCIRLYSGILHFYRLSASPRALYSPGFLACNG